MLNPDPCKYRNIEYVDAINELQQAKNELEKLVAIKQGNSNTNVKTITKSKAIDRVRRAQTAFHEKLKALKECQEKNIDHFK